MIHDGSHLKIKSISLYYNFPVKSWKKNKTIQELQCYVTGTNLFTFTSYKGYDPEVNTGTEGGYKVYSADIPGFFLRSSLAKTHRDNSDKTIRDILPNSFQLSDIDSFLCFSATISTSGATQYSPEQNSEE